MNPYTFKVVTTIFSWKFTMFQNSFSMFKALKKTMWTSGFFVSKILFHYQMFTKLFQFFCECQYIPQKRIHVFKIVFKKKTYAFFRFWYSNFLKHYYSFEFVIMVQSKVVDLTIIWLCLLDCSKATPMLESYEFFQRPNNLVVDSSNSINELHPNIEDWWRCELNPKSKNSQV